MLEKQDRDDSLRDRYGLHADVDLGDEDVDESRRRWEAGRERVGLTIDQSEDAEGSGSGDLSVRANAGTPGVRRNGKARASGEDVPDLTALLRKTTAKKYNAFGDVPTTKGRIKDSGALTTIVGSIKGTRGHRPIPEQSPNTTGLLAGYGSDD